MMNQLNQIWKEHTGKDLTEDEAWKMVEVVNYQTTFGVNTLQVLLKEGKQYEA